MPHWLAVLLWWFGVGVWCVFVSSAFRSPSTGAQRRETDLYDAMYEASVQVETQAAHAVPIEHGVNINYRVLHKPKFLEVQCETRVTGAACGCAGGNSGVATAPTARSATRPVPTVPASGAPGAVDHAEVLRRVHAASKPIGARVRRGGLGVAPRGAAR